MKIPTILALSWALAGGTPAAQGQPSPRAPITAEAPAPPTLDLRNARETRQLLHNLLQQYPPSLSVVLRVDPSLLTNQAYLAPYPGLAGFLAQHPEIAHNPGFFMGGAGDVLHDFNNSPEDRALNMWNDALAGMAVFTAGMIVISVFCWVLKTVIDHRRWLRVSKIQSEVHSKLLDRFASNQELLAYVQTPAGRRFLESAPISIDSPSRGLTAPLGRILFSIQVGIVLALAGVGFLFVSYWLAIPEVTQPLFVIGVLALSLGVGFVISSAAAYIMSRQLGLFNQTPAASATDGAGVSPPHA